MRIFALLAAVLASQGSAVPFQGSVAPLSPSLRSGLRKQLWHRGCPVALSSLRAVTVSYRGFDGAVHSGQLVVNAAVANPLLKVFRRLYYLHFPIREMNALDLNAADDTAAFDCRNAAPSPCPGSSPTGHWSEHAFGEAVDVNPRENPYTGCGVTRDPASRPYLNRSRHRPGMVTPAVVSAFASIGWGWGGNWTGTQDYMHFSANGH